MRIILINKNGKVGGEIESKDFYTYCYIRYKGKTKIIKDIQKLLSSYFKLKYVSGEGNKVSSLIIKNVKINKSRKHGSLSYHKTKTLGKRIGKKDEKNNKHI